MIWFNRFIWCVLVSLALYCAWPYLERLQAYTFQVTENLNLDRVEHAQRSLTYLISQARWTEFPLNSNDQLLRVVSNANLVSQNKDYDTTWHYAFEYQILDQQGEVVVQHIYHHRARILEYEDEDKKPRPNKYFYADPELNPSSGQIMMINLEQQASIGSIRLRLHAKDAAIVDVNVRLYQPSPVAQYKYNFFWKRLHSKQKERLASGNLYPLALVNAQEIHNIMANYFSPLGPTGIEGKDYDVRTLYIDKLYEVETVGELIMPSGLLVFEGFHGTIPIQKAMPVTLHFIPIVQDAVSNQAQVIRLRWYGKKRAQQRTFQVAWANKATQKILNLDAGLLEVISPHAVVVRAYQLDTEITPKKNALRMYKLAENHAVNFAIEHVNHKATPFRVMLRSMLRSNNQTVRWQILAKNNAIIEEGLIELDHRHSHYDRPLNHLPFSAMSEPNYRYFSIPQQGVRLHLESDSPLLVAAYSRPFQLVRHLRVPQDYEWFVEQAGEQRAWFVVRPLAYQQLLANGQSQMVKIQTRPPVDHPDLLQGRYLWEDYHPQGVWRARYLLLKREYGKKVRNEAIASVFSVIPLNQQLSLNFKANIGRAQLQPSIIVLNAQKTQAHIEIILDGHKVYSQAQQGSQVEIKLPRLTQGNHRLQVNSRQNLKVLVNHTGAARESYSKRLANRFDQKVLRFHYHKSTAKKEALTAVFYPPVGKWKKIRLRVLIQAEGKRKKGANKGWTFLRRSFDLSPQQNSTSHVLNSHAERVGDGLASFVVFDEDLPQGNYRISVIRESGPAGYLTLFKLRPGRHEQRSLFRAQQP